MIYEVNIIFFYFFQYKFLKPRDRSNGSLHNETSSIDLTTLRNVLQEHQSLHNYPSTLPGMYDDFSRHPDHFSISSGYSKDYSSNAFNGNSYYNSMNPPILDPIQLCAKISRNSDLLNGDRPSQSLPGSPRKIRVATMLPDVGNNSPDLRYGHKLKP